MNNNELNRAIDDMRTQLPSECGLIGIAFYTLPTRRQRFALWSGIGKPLPEKTASFRDKEQAVSFLRSEHGPYTHVAVLPENDERGNHFGNGKTQ